MFRHRSLESCLRSKDSRAVWRGAVGKGPQGTSLAAYPTASPVLNGGDEETGLCRPRLVATQLESGDFFYGEWGGAIVLYNHLMPRPSSSLLSINISYMCISVLSKDYSTQSCTLLQLAMRIQGSNWLPCICDFHGSWCSLEA
jgi:hypothetical protein